VQLGPLARARAEEQKPNWLAAEAQRQHEQPRTAVLPGLGMPQHRCLAVVDRRLLAGRGFDDGSLLRRPTAAQLAHEALHAGVPADELVVADQVLPDRLGVAAEAEPARCARGAARSASPPVSGSVPPPPIQGRGTPPPHWPVLRSPRREGRGTPPPQWPLWAGYATAATGSRRLPPCGSRSLSRAGLRSPPGCGGASSPADPAPALAATCRRSRRSPRRGTTSPTPPPTSWRLTTGRLSGVPDWPVLGVPEEFDGGSSSTPPVCLDSLQFDWSHGSTTFVRSHRYGHQGRRTGRMGQALPTSPATSTVTEKTTSSIEIKTTTGRCASA